jgi:hypothetical protein
MGAKSLSHGVDAVAKGEADMASASKSGKAGVPGASAPHGDNTETNTDGRPPRRASFSGKKGIFGRDFEATRKELIRAGMERSQAIEFAACGMPTLLRHMQHVHVIHTKHAFALAAESEDEGASARIVKMSSAAAQAAAILAGDRLVMSPWQISLKASSGTPPLSICLFNPDAMRVF